MKLTMSADIREDTLAALEKYREAMRLTREYVGEDVLPAIGGWAWFDADEQAKRILAKVRGSAAFTRGKLEPYTP